MKTIYYLLILYLGAGFITWLIIWSTSPARRPSRFERKKRAIELKKIRQRNIDILIELAEKD